MNKILELPIQELTIDELASVSGGTDKSPKAPPKPPTPTTPEHYLVYTLTEVFISS